MANLDRHQAQSSSRSACRVYPHRETACASGIRADAGLIEAIHQLVQTNKGTDGALPPRYIRAKKVTMSKAFQILFLSLAAAVSHAQQTTATLLGTVTDASGAAVPGVTVQASNLGTNVVREATSDAGGSYFIPNLPPGNYRVRAAKEGFQAARVESVTLQVEQAARLDLKLKVGSITETVSVSASATVLQTENASVGTVIDAAKIVDLPLNGRNFIQLAQLIPGVQAGTPGSITVRRGRGSVGQTDAAYGSTAASANGSRDTANRFYLDGIEVMDYDAMTYSFSPSVDSLAEFKVQTSTYSAEYGGPRVARST